MGRNRQTTLWVVLMVVLSACAKQVDYYDIEIPKGPVTMTNESPLRVSDEMILEIVGFNDERCPVGIVCCDPGVIKVKFSAFVDGEFVEHEIDYCGILHAECSDTLKGHTIHILNVTPIPFPDEPIDPCRYRVEIQVEKN